MNNRIIQDLIKKHVVRYSPAWVDSHTAFTNIVYPNAERRRDPDYLRTKLVRREVSTDANLLLAVDQNKVVGQLGLIEVEIILSGVKKKAVWGVNLVVLPEYLGVGFGGLLELKAIESYQNFLGFGVSPDSAKNQIRRKAKIMRGPFVAYGRLWDMNHLIYKSYPQLKIVGWFVKSLSNVNSWFFLTITHVLKVKGPDLITDEVKISEELSEKEAPAENYVVHDLDFCKWRIVEPVRKNYKKYTLVLLFESYVLVDEAKQNQIVDFYFDSFFKALRLLFYVRSKYQVHNTQAGVLVNRFKDLLPFFLTGFLTTIRRRRVYINGNCITNSDSFYLTGLDADATI